MKGIVIQDLTKTYGKTHAVDSLSLTFSSHEHYVIQGASGSGKSTLLYMMGGLEQPTQGRIIVEGQDLAKLDDERLASYRNRQVGFIFQFHFLLPSMSCLSNILLPAKIGNADIDACHSLAKTLAERLKVTHCLDKFPYQLSGGEQQRVNIIRALSLKPKLLLCDEPTGNLDSSNSKIVTELLIGLAKEFKSTLIVVTHDTSVAAHFQNQIRLVDGKLQ